MATTMIERIGQLAEILLGNLGARVNLRGYDGVEKNPIGGATTSSGNYGLTEQATHGKHAAFPLAATAATAPPTPANSAVLIEDTGLLVGAGKAVRVYGADGTGYGQFTSDNNGLVTLGGSGTSAGDIALSGGAWVAWVPVLTQGASTPTFTTTYAKYRKLGKTVNVQCELAVTSAGVIANQVSVTLPAALTAATGTGHMPIGQMRIFRTGVTIYNTHASLQTATLVVGHVENATSGPIGLSPSFALAIGDKVAVNLMYELA